MPIYDIITYYFVQKWIIKGAIMFRSAITSLKDWKISVTRKPLIIRGARQVGKSYLIREFGQNYYQNFIEINLEARKDLASLFSSSNPQKIIQGMELEFNTKIAASDTLIFIDEIQNCPQAISALRFFYEEANQYHIITAGSLIEFVLGDLSIPVGRVEYLFLGPMTFLEFLKASGEDLLVNFIQNLSLANLDISENVHNKLLNLMKSYFYTGGMPAAIRAYLQSNSYLECNKEKASIINTYRDDFHKYKKRIDYNLLSELFSTIPAQLGKKVKYCNLNAHVKSREIKANLDLLQKARIITPIHHSSASIIPLDSQINPNFFKYLFLDIGLAYNILGINFNSITSFDNLITANDGGLAEQFVGQELLHGANLRNWYDETKLFYWAREQRGASAEIDYIISINEDIFPIEVKSGATGKMRSLQQFIHEKKTKVAFRFCGAPPSIIKAQTADKKIAYDIVSLPLYLASSIKQFKIERIN